MTLTPEHCRTPIILLIDFVRLIESIKTQIRNMIDQLVN